MSVLRPLSWENFRSTVLVRGEQRVHRVSDLPSIEIFGDGISNRIGIWIDTPTSTELPSDISNLAFINAAFVDRAGRNGLDLSTSSSALFRQFYHFAVAVSERIIVDGTPVIAAVTAELSCFSDLFKERSLLGTERQIGLIGELLFLERLIAVHGEAVVDSWLGPMGEPHDFRLGTREFEVKTTVSAHRIHMINGQEQLVPSKDCELFLVSAMLGPAGASTGFSLADKVDQLMAALSLDAQTVKLRRGLDGCGFREEDKQYYCRRFAVRRPLAMAKVDEHFPAITRATIQAALGSMAPRVDSITYELSIEGLEREDGTPEFEAAINGGGQY